MELINRATALALGLPRYFDGKSCPKGHLSEKSVHSHSCCQCIKDSTNKRRRTEAGRKRQADYYTGVKANHLERIMFQTAKRRARESGLPFNIEPDDIRKLFPKDGKCPALGMPLDFKCHNNAASPTLDRLLPELGYVRGNIAVISMRANRMKNDVTDPELFSRMAQWMRKALRKKSTNEPDHNSG